MLQQFNLKMNLISKGYTLKPVSIFSGLLITKELLIGVKSPVNYKY